MNRRIRTASIVILCVTLALGTTGSGGFAAWLGRGEQASADTRYQQAIQAFFAAAAWLPSQALPYVRLGQVYVAQGRSKLAYDALWQAHLRQPDDVPTMMALGAWCMGQGLPNQAADWYTQAMLRSGSDVAIRYALGQARIAQGDRVAAAQALSWALELDDAYLPAHYALGMVLAPTESEQALAHLTRAIGDPDWLVKAQDMIGTIRQVETLGETADAAALFGLAYLRAEWWALALDQLQWASWRLPENAEVQAYLGYVLYQLGDNAQATEQLRRAVALDPGYAQGHHFLALAYHRAGWLREATESLGQAYQLAADDPAIAAEIAQVYVDAGAYDWAASWFEQAVTASHGAAEYVLLQAAFHIQHGYQVQEGMSAAEVAGALLPGDAFVRALLGRGSYLLGDTAQAEQALLEAVALDPTFDLAHYYLADLYGATDRPKEAAYHYQRVADVTTTEALRERAWQMLK